MTGLAQSTEVAAPAERAEVSESTKPIQPTAPARGKQRWLDPLRAGRHALGWLACGVAGSMAIAWFIVFGPGETGSRAEWFFGAVVFVVVIVAMWQNLSVQRQAKQAATEAGERLRSELVAVDERLAREMTLTERLLRSEIEVQEKLHRAEMEAQRELARVERSHLVRFLQKQAMIEVSRAVSVHTQLLASLWNQSAGILRNADRGEREKAMAPIFEQISQVVNDFSVELDNAYLLIEDVGLHEALNRVNEAALMAIRVAEDIHVAVVEGREPQSNPIPSVQRLMHGRAAEARRLAWDLLRTTLDDSKARRLDGSRV